MEVLEALQKVQDKANELQRAFKAAIPSFEDPTGKKGGISLLQAKYATLLRYNLSLTRMVQARIRGSDTTTIANTLVEDWVALNKIRPLEKKLKYQIDALLKNLAKGKLSSRPDEERHRPNPDGFVFSDSEEDKGDEDDEGVYRPPRIAEVAYDEGDRKRKEKDLKAEDKYQARKLRTEGVREMLNEIKGRPEELRDDDRDGVKSKAVQRLLREEDERRKYEEEHFTRLTITRKDKKRRREIERKLDGPTGDGDADFDGLEALADRVLASSSSKGGKTNSRHGGKNIEREEQYKLQQLDRITEQMNGGRGGSSGRLKQKRRRKMRG